MDDDNVAASLDGAAADPADAEAALPTPPPAFQTGSSGAPAGPAAESRARSLAAIGSVKLKIGQINANTEKRDEEEVELPRFSSARLGESLGPFSRGTRADQAIEMKMNTFRGNLVMSLTQEGRSEPSSGLQGRMVLPIKVRRLCGNIPPSSCSTAAVVYFHTDALTTDTRTEYLAVTTVSNPEAPLCHVSPSSGGSYARSRSMIQLWSIPCNPARDELNYELPKREETQSPRGRMKLEVGLCVDGDVGEIAWCPRGGSSKPQSATSEHEREDAEQKDAPSPAKAKGKTKGKGKGKAKAGKEDQAATATDQARVDPGRGTVNQSGPHLGILAAVMADGALSFFAIPDPSQMPSAQGANPAEPSAPSFGTFSRSRSHDMSAC